MNRQPETGLLPSWDEGQLPEQQGGEIPLLDYLQLLWFRRRLIVAITVFVAVVGWIQVNQIKSVYTASSKLMIGVTQSKIVDIESVLSREYYDDEISTEMEVLRSRLLASKAVERMGLVNYEEFNPSLRVPEESFFDFLRYLNPRTWIPASWKRSLKEAMGRETEQDPVEPPGEDEVLAKQVAVATSIFLAGLTVEEVDWAGVIIIRFSSRNPELAARIANEYPEVYMVDQMEARFEATEKANAWLTEQLGELEKKVAESERAVEIYREEHGLGGASGTNLLDAQLSELNSQLIVARAERAEIEARLAQIRRLLQGGQGIETMSEVLSSTMIQQLRGQELAVRGRASELSVEFGPKHPRMLQVQAELAEIQERIAIEVNNVAAGLENEAEFARTRVRSLEESLGQAQDQSSGRNKEAVQLRALQREAAANRALFETFLGRFKETSTTQGMEASDARVISAAEVPGGPSYPNRRKMLMNYIVAGFLGACGLVLGLQFLNPGLRSPEQVHQVLGEFVIGLIPKLTGKMDFHDYVLNKPQSGVVEAINSLKFSLALSNPDIEVKAVQVTSSAPEEGKTSLALGLARVVASSGKKVILVDGDLRRSSIVKKLGLESGHKGLSDLVASGEDELSEFVIRDEKGKMDYMPIGTAAYANASDIFSSRRMETIVELLKSHYDLVVLDSPPVMVVADAMIIGRLMDKTLFVVRWEKTPRKVARAALEQLQRSGTDVAGVVLQQVDLERYGRIGLGGSGYYYHYGRYGKYYSG
jgi:capsular exopolysaccharide synthesis family protein